MNQMTLEFTEDKKKELTKKEVMYCTVKFSPGWLPGSVGFTDAAKSAMVAARGTSKNAIRGSYAILGASRDPLIKEGAALKRLLTTVRDEYTIPEYTLRATASGNEEKPEKVKGSYLIESCRIEEFLQRFEVVRKQYLTWGKRVAEPENYNRLYNADKEALGMDWEIVEKKYPSAADLADSISCDMPKIEPFDASFTLADVAPATSKMLCERAQSSLDASVDGVVGELIAALIDDCELLGKNCGKRVRLLPPMGPKQDLRHAEVMQILKHSDDADIPEDKFLVTVQQAKPKDENSDKFINVGKSHDMLLTEEEYKALRPYETDEYRQLTTSTFENVMWRAKKIQTIKNMLGDDEAAQDLTSLAKEIESLLGDLGGTASEITKQLKGSNFARKTSMQQFQTLETRLKATEVKRQEIRRVQRKVKLGGGNVN